MERIRAAGGRVSFDPNIREEVWRQPEALRPCLQKALLLADVVKLSREELAFISHLDDLENAIRWMMQTLSAAPAAGDAGRRRRLCA